MIAREIAASLEPADGWMSEDTSETVAATARLMLETTDAEEVKDTLSDLIKALRAEYGD